MSINSVAEEFERLEVEVENILATDPQGEVLEMETTETTTSNTASTELAITEIQTIVPKKTILIPPSRDDPNRVFKQKKVTVNNPPPPNPPTSCEDRQARNRSSLHNFYRRRRFSQDLRMF